MLPNIDKITGMKLGSAGIMNMSSENIGLHINNDLISRLLAAGALHGVLREDKDSYTGAARGFQAYYFSGLDVKTVYTVLFIENSLLEMGRNTRTPFKNQYYALGRYFYELYAESNDIFSVESFIAGLPEDIVAEGLAKKVIEEPEGTRSYNKKLAECVVITFFYYMTLIGGHGSYDINELTYGLKDVIYTNKAATLLNYSPARAAFRCFTITEDDGFSWIIDNRKSCFEDIKKIEDELSEDMAKDGYLECLQGWCELIVRADTSSAYLSRKALSNLRSIAGRNKSPEVEEGKAFLSWLMAVNNA